jgi:arsenite methyltransferase
MTTLDTHGSVQEYYGKVLDNSDKLQTNACCCSDSVPLHLKSIINKIEPEIVQRFYGCGSPIPAALDGCTVLDLGCGTGRDTYVCSKLVGPQGHVIGVDMTAEQIEIAQRHADTHAKRFGYPQPNVTFKQGYIEDLSALDIADNSVDVVISNCVINLSPDKLKVFSEIFRVLKPGGELYFSDVFADRRMPAEWRSDPVLLGECLAGALYVEDFRRMLASLGVPDYRVVEKDKITIDNPQLEEKVGSVCFGSITVRAFKLAALEDRCEDFGQIAFYNGTIPHHPHVFELDSEHRFETNKPVLVCGNTAAMLSESRFGKHFRVQGDRSQHFGLFPCSPAAHGDVSENNPSGCC